MKKLTVALFASIFVLVIFALASCGATTDADLLGYQTSGAEVKGVLHTDTGAFRLEVTLSPSSADELASGSRDAVLTFISADGSDIYSATVADGGVSLSACGLSVPCGDVTGAYFKKLTSLFAIDGNALYSVENGSDGTVTASFGVRDGEAVIVTLDPVTSLPKKISAQNGAYSYEIDEYRLISDPTETDG